MAAILTLLLVCAPGDRVVLRDSAPVDGRFVKLFDLIDTTSLAPETLELLKDVWLGRAPEDGKSRTITMKEIQRELERRKIDTSGLIFVGDSVTVKRADTEQIRATRAVEDLIRAELKEQFLQKIGGIDKTKYAVLGKYFSPDTFPPNAELLSVTPREALRIGRVAFKAVVLDGQKKIDVEGYAQICRVVAVAFTTKKLRRNHILRKEDIMMKQLKIESDEGYCTEVGLIIGGKLLENVEAGEKLSPGHIKFRDVIRPGDSVIVKNEFVSNVGVARDRGTLGDHIRVEFLRGDGKKSTVRCRVTGPGKAKFIEGEK